MRRSRSRPDTGVVTIAMGLYANYPFALAAGLGLNAFVAFTLVVANGLPWPEAMGVIAAEGILITILVLTGAREAILNAIPMDLKRAIGIGIGAFIALIGLVNAGVVVRGEGTVLTLAPVFRAFTSCQSIRRKYALGFAVPSSSSTVTWFSPVEMRRTAWRNSVETDP